MAKQDVAVELFYDGAWHDLVTDDEVLAGVPITIMRGDADDSPTIRPASIALRLNNATDKFRTSNPMSDLYGKAGVNTELRVSVAGKVRGHVQASSWTADEDSDFRAEPRRGNAWVDVQGGGLLQQVGQWSRNIKPPLQLATEAIGSLTGYWACQDPAGAVLASAGIPGVASAPTRGHSFGSQNSPPGGGTAVDVGATPAGVFTCLPGDPASTAGWQYNRVIFINKLTSQPGDSPSVGDSLMFAQLYGGATLLMNVNGATGMLTLTLNSNGVDLLGASVDVSSYQWAGRWIMVQLQATYSAGTTTVGAYWRATDEDFWTTFSDTYTGATSQIQYVFPNGMADGSSYGHVAVTSGTADALTSGDRFEAFCGHPGERVAYRFGRTADENNIPYYVSPGFDASQRCGPQGADQLIQIWQDLKGTDDAIIYDHLVDLRAVLFSVADRYNQTPKLILDAAGQDHGMPSRPAEVLDEIPVHNIVTAKQRGGGTFTAEDATSSMGSQDPPSGRGPYKQDVNVNVADPDAQLVQEAHWWLGRGTVPDPRFPTVTVDLTELSAAQLAAVESVDIGRVIGIVNYRENMIRLWVVGYKETIWTHRRQIVFTCAPDRQFNAGQLDANRLQARYTVVVPALDATSTTLTLFNAEPSEQWRPGVSGAHIMLGGEEIILGTIGARTGTNPFSWTVTGCTRSVNGIVKAHQITDRVIVKDAIRLTLGDRS